MKHYFLPRDKIIYTYVITKQEEVSSKEGAKGKKKEIVTDFLSFYSLPSHVMNNPKHNMLYVFFQLSRRATHSITSQLQYHIRT